MNHHLVVKLVDVSALIRNIKLIVSAAHWVLKKDNMKQLIRRIFYIIAKMHLLFALLTKKKQKIRRVGVVKGREKTD